jgi:hypothetical protein
LTFQTFSVSHIARTYFSFFSVWLFFYSGVMPQLALEAVKGWIMCRKNIHHSSAYFVKFLNPLSHNIFFLAETFNSLDSVSFPHSKIISFLFKFQLRTEHFQWFTARSSYSHDAIATIHIQTTSRKGRRFDFHLNSFFFFRLHLIPFHVFFEAARLCNSLRFIFLFLIILLWNKKHTKKQRGGKKCVQKKWNCMLLVLASVTGDGYCIIAV